MGRTLYLENTSDGHSKFYEMSQENPYDANFTVRYGKIGQIGGTKTTYPIAEWNKKLDEKRKKGYQVVRDVATPDFQKAAMPFPKDKGEPKKAEVTEEQKWIYDHYVSVPKKIQIEDAKKIIDVLKKTTETISFMQNLRCLYRILGKTDEVPFVDGNYEEQIAKEEKEFQMLIDKISKYNASKGFQF